MTKLHTVVLLVLVGLLAASAALWWHERARAVALEGRVLTAERALAATEAEKIHLSEALQLAKKRASDVATQSSDKADEDATERKQAKKEAHAAAKQVARLAETGGVDKSGEMIASWISGAEDPAVVRRLNEQARLQIMQRYGALFDTLALGPDQRDQLIKLLADKRQVAIDVAAASFARGDDPRDDLAGYRDMVAVTREDLEKQIHALLGDSAYDQFQNFNRAAGQSQVMGRLSQLMAEIRQPLTLDQTDRLQSSMQAAGSNRISSKVVADAKEFLSPAQLQALQDLRAMQQANSRKRNQPLPVLPTNPPTVGGQ